MAEYKIDLNAYPAANSSVALSLVNSVHRRCTVNRLGEIAPCVASFGRDIWELNPSASFVIWVTMAKGQRKPPGFDKADFGGEARLMRDVPDKKAGAFLRMKLKAPGA